jgi:hypothetical protein
MVGVMVKVEEVECGGSSDEGVVGEEGVSKR